MSRKAVLYIDINNQLFELKLYNFKVKMFKYFKGAVKTFNSGQKCCSSWFDTHTQTVLYIF